MQQIQYIKTNQLHESSMNPRKEFHQESIDQLAESIKQVGILQPIIARLNTTVKQKKIPIYEVICGARRLSAAVIADLTEVPVIVRELSDEEAFDLMITENLQRKDVSPLEEATAFQSLINKGKYDVLSLSDRFGKSVTYIRQRLQLNELISEFRQLLNKEVITVSHAIEISKLDHVYQNELL
ncbi:MAG: ParB/RepB/Spo0J family partition protein, partial [Bacteroidales bacterium]|nr:ParB/RepB/Spo0J family partition protein [Bacteroidales bacterium]